MKDLVCSENHVHENIVSIVKEKMPDDDLIYDLAELFKVFGDSTRMKIICALLQEELCVCDIANVLAMSKSSISHRLSTLRRCGIVKCRKEGKEVYYTLDDEHVKEVYEVALSHVKEILDEKV